MVISGMDERERRRQIGIRIARLREALQLSQQELADSVGVARPTVANWETGRKEPRGEVGYHWNGEHLKTRTKLGKVVLANYIAQKLGRKDLCFETPPWETGFNIFYHRPQRGRQR